MDNNRTNTDNRIIDNVNGSDLVNDKTIPAENKRRYNIQNLKPYNKTDNILTSEEAKRRGRNGAKKSAEVRRARKTMKETILELMEKEVNPDNYGIDSGILGDKATMQEVIMAAMLREAANGSEKAAQLLRDTIGEAPVNRQEIKQEVITQDDLQTIDNLKRYLTG